MKGTTPQFEKYEQSMGLFLFIDIDNEIEIQIYEIRVSDKNVLNKYQYVKQYFCIWIYLVEPQENISTETTNKHKKWTSGSIVQGIKYEGKSVGKYSRK